MAALDSQEQEKRLAAQAAIDLVQDGMTVGLGTGSTAAHFIRGLGARVRSGLTLRAIATSIASEQLARDQGIVLTSFADVTAIDLTVDGADEVDRELRLIKGAGGALLREKIVAAASEQLVIIVDSGKLVERLGGVPLPVEVVPFGWQAAARTLVSLGGQPVLRCRAAEQPLLTDGGHYILDCRFDSMGDPDALARALDQTVGVVEHGLFLDLADTVIVGEGDHSRKIGRSR